ncbi:hypothetical protein PoB_007592200 [Plakobranchus ocellatus]|uniref:Uncharacterized protein n=1 Tax=Plakobranchus ocellatus TaxID=259542 RepID=A0AAV4DZE9_9GAST|nr:hypothetical protein PoB_007592200 [Plakobranchus ocellatus]
MCTRLYLQYLCIREGEGKYRYSGPQQPINTLSPFARDARMSLYQDTRTVQNTMDSRNDRRLYKILWEKQVPANIPDESWGNPVAQRSLRLGHAWTQSCASTRV